MTSGDGGVRRPLQLWGEIREGGGARRASAEA